MLNTLLKQWPDIHDKYKILSYGGRHSLKHAARHLNELKDIIPNAAYVIHTDRDFLQDHEVNFLAKLHGIESHLFATEGNDIEWYFTQQEYLQHKGISFTPQDPDYNNFLATRGGATACVAQYDQVNSHVNAWNDLPDEKKHKGKDLLKAIINAAGDKQARDARTKALHHPSNLPYELAGDLKDIITRQQVDDNNIEATHKTTLTAA